MDNFEKNLRQMIENDQLNFKPDPSIHSRLFNYLNVRAVFSNVRKNAFIPSLKISSKWMNTSWKYGVAASFFILVMFGAKMKKDSSLYVQNDTINSALFIDSMNLDTIGDFVK